MAKPHPFFLLLCLCLLSITTVATPAITPQQQAAYHELLKLKLNHGRSLVQDQLKSAPDNAVNILLENYSDFLELCVQQNKQEYDKLLSAQEERLEALEDKSRKDVWDRYATAEVRMQLAMCKLLFGNRLSAAWDFRKAFQEYSKITRQHPSFLPAKKNLGVLQVLIGSVPDQYTWFLNIIGLKGSVPQGMQNLKAATSLENPFNQEAQLLHTVLLHLTAQDKEQQALRQAKRLTETHQDNLLTAFVAMHLLKKSKQADAALQIYQQKPSGAAYLPFPYLHHMAADLYLFRGDYEKSIKVNTLFLKQHKGEHYLKSANFKLYLAYALSNHPPQASWYWQQIPEAGIAEAEEDKYAARYHEKKEELIAPLMAARLHSDGGYYTKALQELSKLKLTAATPVAVRGEYYYRKARIYHGQDMLQQAVPLYKNTIKLCEGSDLYFAPNAALQLGYIFAEFNKPEQAKAFFKKALSYKNHEYKNSIDAKAKLALAAL